ncbi:unnamed protein product [Ilex paraguariensis]|uniref:BRI1 kinase inhibitor 1 n=1 Tax=Ilex paraguariensis TaxID=185542 RepID=A0ABC8U9N5_9AQUA
MEAQLRHQKMREKVEEEMQIGEGKLKKEGLQQYQQQQTPQSSSSTSAVSPPVPVLPPSASSSPTHEFSFTISLHPEATRKTDKSKAPPSFAVDLSPADEIFFHGKLLPLHLLSHLPVSPRSSTNSLDSFTLPIRELLEDPTPEKRSAKSFNFNGDTIDSNYCHQSKDPELKGRTKSKSFSSLFGLPKWRKGCEEREKEEKERHKKKLKFDVSHVLKRYIRMVRPLLAFRLRRGRRNMQFQKQPYSFSGNLGFRDKPDLRGRRGQLSAPVSMRASPANSGPLVPPESLSTASSDSTMEELQAAIQAAIAHCKNSIAMEEKIKCR